MTPERKEAEDAIDSALKMAQDAEVARPEESVQQFVMEDIDDAGAEKGKEQTWKAFLDAPKIDMASAAGMEQPLVDQPEPQSWAADAQHMEGPPAPPYAELLGDAGDEAREPFQQPSAGKKKRQSANVPTDWGKFLGAVGKGIGSLGSATGSKELSGIGGGLQGMSQIMSAVSSLGGSSQQESESGGVGDTITNVLGAVGSGTQGSAPGAQGADTSDDLQKAIEKLTDAVTQLIEKMGGQASSGVGGTQMPAGGSLGGAAAGDGIDLKQIVQIIELIMTMSRMLAMVA